MKKLILITSLISIPMHMHALPLWDSLRTMFSDDLDTAEYLLDKYPHPPTPLKDIIWLLLRNGFRKTAAIYARNKKIYGRPNPHNAMSIIETNIDTQKRWARIFAKAVAKNIRLVIDDELYTTYTQHRTYHKETLDHARSYEGDDPE